MDSKLKLWQLSIDENDFNTGVEYVALVDDPAIMRNWLSFAAAQKIVYKIASQDRHIVMGPLMIPNMPIFRSDDIHGDHYVMYSKESIEKIVRKFFKQKNTGNVNLMHLPAATTSNVFMLESFIIDSTRGISAPKGFDNLPDGTWFGSYAVQDDQIWSAVQDGTFKGFSVEGYFGYSEPKDVDQSRIDNLISAVTNGTPEQIKYLLSNKGDMNILEKILPADKVAALKVLFGNEVPVPATPAPVAQADSNKAMTTDGKELYAEGGFLQGNKIFVVTPDGQIPAPDGSYTLDNGTVCEVTGGTIMNVTTAADTSATPAPDPNAQYKALEDKFNAFVAETKSALEAMGNSVKMISEKFTLSEATFSEFKTELGKVQEVNKLMYDVFTKLEGTPAHVDVTKPKNDIFQSEAAKDEERIKSLSASIKRIKTA